MMTEVHDIDIQKILPQAAPFIMIDAVTDYQPGRSLTAVKNITANEWSTGPLGSRNNAEPAYPEVLLIEAAAQTALVFASLEHGDQNAGVGRVVLGKITAEFQDSVRVGDQVQLRISAFKILPGRGYVDVVVTREDVEIGQVNIFYSLVFG
ncbi:MAG: hypothetical protein K8I00_01760 [Candidatus Omnitrophica bacterium]|nr:hypothetical protein [Candidatus Omnitrophota bacterium]